jgi:hypothetical protein
MRYPQQSERARQGKVRYRASTDAKRVEVLADELFSAIQMSQGYFYVSDGETFESPAKFFERIRGRLKYGRQAVRLMEAFLRNHRELRDPRKG